MDKGHERAASNSLDRADNSATEFMTKAAQNILMVNKFLVNLG